MESQKILIIDDNNENIKVAANIIKADNNIVWATLNVKEGIKIAEMKSPDLILLDVQMPIMDGYEACSILKSKEATKEIPVMFMTARTDDESIHKAYQAGAVDYITKPIKKMELLARVHTQLKLSGMIKCLKKASVTDGLTKLYNHKKILELLNLEIDRAKRYKRDVSIMMLDIDHFKRVNDDYGHVVGDTVLERLAFVIKQQIRDLDMVGRYGGEEFLIIFPEINQSQAYQVAERLRKTVEALIFDDGLTITISGGVAEYSDEKTEHFIKKADDNLYKAKNSGRNKIIS
ncbi:MAG TPA: diguanylate cyclase [Thermotogota bacterium]|nr:diguanylate cyclase [Thermotogota bacterium]HRW35056.1 diguanylate cyclase [Thermotogota bacterium]